MFYYTYDLTYFCCNCVFILMLLEETGIIPKKNILLWGNHTQVLIRWVMSIFQFTKLIHTRSKALERAPAHSHCNHSEWIDFFTCTSSMCEKKQHRDTNMPNMLELIVTQIFGIHIWKFIYRVFIYWIQTCQLFSSTYIVHVYIMNIQCLQKIMSVLMITATHFNP